MWHIVCYSHCLHLIKLLYFLTLLDLTCNNKAYVWLSKIGIDLKEYQFFTNITVITHLLWADHSKTMSKGCEKLEKSMTVLTTLLLCAPVSPWVLLCHTLWNSVSMKERRQQGLLGRDSWKWSLQANVWWPGLYPQASFSLHSDIGTAWNNSAPSFIWMMQLRCENTGFPGNKKLKLL